VQTPTSPRAPIPVVVQQHVEDTLTLRGTRAVLVRAPHVKLHQLRRLDDRLAAHLDGLQVAGDAAARLCLAALETPGRGALFAAGVLAIERRDMALIERLLAIAQTDEAARAGLVSAFGWVPAAALRGITKALLDSSDGFAQGLGLTACALHQVDPGALLDQALAGSTATLAALDAAGRLGRTERLGACLALLGRASGAALLPAARAACLLGDRQAAPAALGALALQDAPTQAPALALLLKILPVAQANALLKLLAQDGRPVRTLIRAIGVAGDPHYVPWLLKQMADDKLARLAGESFSAITGLDLALLDLDRKPPAATQADEDAVALDEDESLPWPDAQKLATWWAANGVRFEPGTRYFAGEPPSTAHCLSVLRTGFQRQRTAAADHLCLLNPGTPLFNTAAPAGRQERLLAARAA